MADEFQYDVFLSHNSKDKPQVRRLGDRLKAAGLRVWLDEWVIKPGDDIYLAIERGLEASRTLVLCLSSHALGSNWVTLERSTVLFRDPTNERRRFIPVLLSECQLPDALRRYRYLSFQNEHDSEYAFNELLAACRPSGDATPSPSGVPAASAPPPDQVTGHWVATLTKNTGQPCKIYLTLERLDDLVFGSVSYPTGDAGILEGKFAGNTLTFQTRHVPAWTEQEVTIKWAAKIVGNELHGFTQDTDGPGKFTAERTNEARRYGWRQQ